MSNHHYTLRQIDELAGIHGGAVKLAAAELGIRSFGLQVLDMPAGFDGYPEHDHLEDGQEEVYLVLSGQAEFTVAGERVALREGSLLRVEPEARRKLHPGPEGVRLLAIGRCVDGAYDRPAGFELAGAGR